MAIHHKIERFADGIPHRCDARQPWFELLRRGCDALGHLIERRDLEGGKPSLAGQPRARCKPFRAALARAAVDIGIKRHALTRGHGP